MSTERAYPGQPGDRWRDSEADLWVLCADGQMRMLDEMTDPEGPAGLVANFGPMESVSDGERPDEQAQAERDADVRAVDALITASAMSDMPAFWTAFDDLRTRYIDRIAALDARTTDGGTK